MPEAGGAFASVGYLIAAAAVTLVGLGTYAALLAQRLAKARARSEQLRGDEAPSPSGRG